MQYPSAKGFIIPISIGFLLVMAIVSFTDHTYIASFILLLLLAYFLWMWFDTNYVIDGGKLYYTCALLKGSIEIAAIFEVVKNKKQFQYSGIKPALSTRGIMVKYNKWDDIYISPQDANGFINALKAVNANINVVE